MRAIVVFELSKNRVAGDVNRHRCAGRAKTLMHIVAYVSVDATVPLHGAQSLEAVFPVVKQTA